MVEVSPKPARQSIKIVNVGSPCRCVSEPSTLYLRRLFGTLGGAVVRSGDSGS
jgi:hypothetical protein